MLHSRIMTVRSHEDRVVLQVSMQLAIAVESLTSRLPAHQQYGLASQLRRAAFSIPSNIAEGSARPTRVYMQHLMIALGSEAEIKTQLKLAVRMRYVSDSEIEPLLNMAGQVGRMLRGLIKSLKAHLARQKADR